MPYKRKPCPTCSGMMDGRASQCRKCKPSYPRTASHRERMSRVLTGKPKPHLQGKKRPGHSETMKAWWTPERREEKRNAMLRRNPDARYHGLSADRAAQIVAAAGQCQRCDHDGSESRLGVHHHNRDKHDHTPKNLEVLCHRCHMQEHTKKGETGWQVYHAKRKSASASLPAHE